MVSIIAGGIFPLKSFALTWTTTEVQIATSNRGKVSTAFSFRNDTGKPVRITSVTDTCDYTTTKLARDFYLPGESGRIEVELAAGDLSGEQEKTILVVADDAPARPVALRLRVDIPDEVSIEPALVLWRVGRAAEKKCVTLRVPSSATVVLGQGYSRDPRIYVELRRMESEGVWELDVCPLQTSRAFQATILVELTLDGKTKPLSVYALVK